ncbi:MAG TPA: signal peptide peptidase SppA [Spirochaetia bacterium]|nr:signal peptide peptidase SppA [Spirochaetia bacterium]
MAWSRKKKAFIIILSVIVLAIIVSLVASRLQGPSGDRIGVVEIEGVISGSKEVMDDIVDFKDDPSIKGVILRINSPGGGVGPTQEIYREVVKLKEKKKVYVSMGTTCASGGYYIASAGQKLYANPSTITGSIGVIMELMNVEDVLKKIGLKANTIKAGEFKDTGSPFRPMTPEERAYMDGIVTNIYDQFTKDVAQGRKMNVETVKKLAEGRIYTGTMAKDAGLVDAIGNFYDTVDAMKAELGIKGKPVLVYPEKPFSLARWVFGTMGHDFTRELANQLSASPFKFLMSQ